MKLGTVQKKRLFDFLPHILGRIAKKIYSKYIGHSEFEIRRKVYFDSIEKCEIGKRVFINRGCKFYAGYAENDDKMIFLGKNVWIGMNTMFICASHDIGNSKQRAGKIVYKPIKIEEGCWIGGGVIILPGVTIERGCVIGAGSIVTKNCEANGVYVGNPAKRVKNLQ